VHSDAKRFKRGPDFGPGSLDAFIAGALRNRSGCNMKELQAFTYLAAVTMLCCGTLRAAEPSESVARALEALSAVHQLSEVVMSPDGKRVIYGDVVTGKRGGADVDVRSVWMK
jgi:hypothetical protein